ncbi:hypothetical protein KY285_023645 [Solanum tuberosum]|nr:hypothetical protein KY289_025744 [Solanum tuberosum]KAH0675844.1 hypothetical protein KY285_023645 [Solanum tuberosum]
MIGLDNSIRMTWCTIVHLPFTGDTPWNVECDCKGCQEGNLDDADRSKSWKKCGNSEKEFKRRFDDGDPTISSISRPGKYEFLVSYKIQNESALHTQNGTLKDEHAHPLFMISPISSSHTYNLPSYSTFEKDNLSHAPKIPQKRVILKFRETMHAGNLEETSCWQSKDIMSQNRLLSTKSPSMKSITPTQVKLATKENKLIDTSVQNVGLIKALEQRLKLIQLDKCPQGSSLFQFFDHQRKEMDFISDRILELKYGRIESAENPIPLPTSFPLSPETHSILRQDNPFSIFNYRSHMSLSFAPIPDENKFDIAKKFWNRKDAAAAQKKTKAALRQSKRKMDLHNRINSKVVPISSHTAPSGDLIYLDPGPSIQHVDLEVSKYDMSPEDHNMIKHGLPDDSGVRHERSIVDNDLINFVQEVSQLYSLDKDDNLDSNLLIEETLSGNEEFYDVVEQQSNSDTVEEQSNSSLDEYRESSIAHIDLTEECGTILDVDEPPQLTKHQQRNRRRSKCHRQARKARMAKLR